jgi:hypothetical protein
MDEWRVMRPQPERYTRRGGARLTATDGDPFDTDHRGIHGPALVASLIRAYAEAAAT